MVRVMANEARRYRLRWVDVFTDRALAGNPLAVVLQADGLSTAQMQAIARETNLSETTFVLPPEKREHAAKVRIFTPYAELPFAGHPTVGTSWVLLDEGLVSSDAAGFTLEAVKAVMSDQGYAASALLEQIANLVAKSLVMLDGLAPAGRWRLLETTRAYALEKLAESGEGAQVARRCAEFLRDLVRPAMHGSRVQPTVIECCEHIERALQCLRFTEGFATPDLLAASAMLQSLSSLRPEHTGH